MVNDRGIPFFGLLGILFIILKLTGAIDWGWWTVTFSLWGLIPISILLAIIEYIYTLIIQRI